VRLPNHKYFNMSKDGDARVPWNQGRGPWPGEEDEWIYIEEPAGHVEPTRGLIDEPVEGSSKTPDQVEKMNEELSRLGQQEVDAAVRVGANQWSTY